MSPRVSVILPVRNGEKYLREAVDSILAQTVRDFELVIVDDGSLRAVGGFADERVRLIRQEPLGLVRALERGLAESTAELVARMDADDVSLPRRLELQIAALGNDSRLGLVGCGIETIDTEGHSTGSWLLPADDSALRRRLLLRNPFAHGSVVFRRAALEAAGGYHTDRGANEDYDLWRRIAREWRLGAIEEVLYRYREHAGAVTKTDVAGRVELRERLRDELWSEPTLLRAVGGERDAREARALTREALRRGRYTAAARSFADALRASTSS
jgi:glycosyltransferase involved in cell wall biosynthesis